MVVLCLDPSSRQKTDLSGPRVVATLKALGWDVRLSVSSGRTELAEWFVAAFV